MLSAALVPLATLAAIIALGAVTRRAGWFGDAAESTLNRFAYHVAFPALVFTSLWRAPLATITDGRLYLVGAIAMLVAGGLAFLLAARARRETRAVAVFAVLFGNTAFLGLPLVALALGADALGPAAALVALYLLVPIPLGTALVLSATRAAGARHVVLEFVRTPLIWAAVLGFPASFLRARLALPLALPPLDLVAAAASPVALFALGMFLATVPLRSLARERGPLALVAVLKLVVFPAVVLAVANAFALGGLSRTVSLVEAAVPTGVSTFTVTRELAGDAEFAAACVLATTLASVVTLAVWLSAIG